MKDETTSKPMIEVTALKEPVTIPQDVEPTEDHPYGIVYDQPEKDEWEDLYGYRRPFHLPKERPKVTPKQPSDIALLLGLLLFMVAVAGVISLGFWYAWPSIQKYAQEKGWTEPTPKPPTPPAVAAAPASEKVTYYHVSCVAQLATGRITFHEFHYSLTDGEPVNPLVLVHNLRQHAAQLTGSSNVIILAVSTLPGGAK